MTPKHHSFQPVADSVYVAKDILELLSTAMYPDPLTLFREYVQNAADAVEQAEAAGLYGRKHPPQINITLDAENRRVIIRDNGIGLNNKDFRRVLSSLGGSAKRGTNARGFRGVGRLAGLGFCQELAMRSKGKGDPCVFELRWDCKKLKRILRDPLEPSDLNSVAREILTLGSQTADADEHFFEVELGDVIRYKNDAILNEAEITSYLAQVGPVPFNPKFSFTSQIESHLKDFSVNTFKIYVNQATDPIYRPYMDSFEVRKGVLDRFNEIEFCSVEGINGEPDAKGWILHHSYLGAIPDRLGIKGLRLRGGNVQIGDSGIFEGAFMESRFNAWTVGEVHAHSKNIVPNGRRDALDFNVHAQNLFNRLLPITKQIAAKCRASSAARAKSRVTEEPKWETGWALTDRDIMRLRALPANLRKSFLQVVSPIFDRPRQDYHGRRAALTLLKRLIR